ncbi:class I histocompatibility antigen, F10 alpha chain-like isoform X2 [Heptranchias perlo]|uniref:class I histocompatibility antigen, F10 alpha chain-like isoform X2 n=1 Tax=Heptranchias perlo TaxID=212740 RepID=UPI00355AB10C
MTPIPGFPDFVVVGYVDEAQFVEYNSERRTMIPRQRWMEEREGPEYWERDTRNVRGAERMGKVNIQTLSTRTNQSGGIHTYQVMYGCELGDDGTTRGFEQHAWDGEDLINFDKDQMVWVTPVQWGEITKNKWDQEKAMNQQRKGYLEEECIEWLRKYLEYGKRELRAVAPVVYFTRPPGTNRLSCAVTGFYPRAIEVNLLRDGESIEETLSSGTLPNHDGTYQVRKWTEFEEKDGAQYSCQVDHSGLGERVLVFYVPESASLLPVIIGVVILILLLTLIAGAVVIYRKRVGMKSGYNPTTTSDKGESSSASSATA